MTRPMPRCASHGCPDRVKQRSGKYCSKRCAWLCRRGYEASAKGRIKAVQVNRAAYVARLRVRLAGMTSAGQIWQAAYRAGFAACYAGYLRKVRKGDVLVVRQRRDSEAA